MEVVEFKIIPLRYFLISFSFLNDEVAYVYNLIMYPLIVQKLEGIFNEYENQHSLGGVLIAVDKMVQVDFM